MAPVALTSSLTSPPGVPLKKSQINAANRDNGVSLDGSSTPYSATSTAVSESGSTHHHAAKVIVDESLPRGPKIGEENYFSHLLASSAPTATTKPGSTVFGSAIEVLEALAVQNSEAVWVYDDAAAVGFGSRLAGWNSSKVFSVQTRQGAGLELAGYSTKSSGRLSVFATTATLPYLVDSLPAIQGEVVIHLGTTSPSESLELSDSLFSAGVVKALTGLPEDWDVVFSARDTVETAAKLYGAGRKVVHVVESTHLAREVSSYTLSSPSSASVEDFTQTNADANEVYVVPAGAFAASSDLPSSTGLISLNTLAPSPEALFAALSGSNKKTVHVVGGTKADADALKNVILGALYSASGSSKAVFPTVKSLVATSPIFPTPSAPTKTVSFYTGPQGPLPQLLAHLFLSSPSLQTRLASFGSSSTRGLKSVLTLSPSTVATAPIAVDAKSDVTWVSDANIHKSTDIIANAAQGSILVLELPWTEEEVAVKLSRAEIIAIKEKKLRVFLLDLDSSAPSNPIREQVAFLLLYTGKQQLPAGVRRVLDAFHSGDLCRDDVEDAQAALFELEPSAWAIPELEEGKVEKTKAAWEWDALPTETGLADVADDSTPVRGSWDLAARHLLFREAFAVSDAKTIPSTAGPSVNALTPSLPDETFLVTVSENRRLTPQTYDRNVFHLELDSTGTGLKYDIGEAIGIHGWNDTQEVLDFINWYGLEANSLVSFPNPQKANTTETRTVFQLLQQNVDLFGRPGKAFYAALAKLATTKADAMTLKFISAPEGAELFKRMAEDETVTYADVLYKFRTARPGIEELVGLVPEIKPRHYSIASSQKAVGDKVELLIVTVDWVNSKGELTCHN